MPRALLGNTCTPRHPAVERGGVLIHVGQQIGVPCFFELLFRSSAKRRALLGPLAESLPQYAASAWRSSSPLL
jgi:hypothetical protein